MRKTIDDVVMGILFGSILGLLLAGLAGHIWRPANDSAKTFRETALAGFQAGWWRGAVAGIASDKPIAQTYTNDIEQFKLYLPK